MFRGQVELEQHKMSRKKHSQLSSRKARSALTNGRHLLQDVDARSVWMRRYRDLLALHISDLGGEDLVTDPENRLIRRAAMLTLQCEMMDRKFALRDGEASQSDLEVYQRLTNTLRRTLESLGLSRRSRDVTPTLAQYLAAKTSAGVSGEEAQ
jgi:hypothetical protein